MTRVRLPADSRCRAPRHLVLFAAVPLLVLPLTLAACGGSVGDPANYPTGKTDVVIQFSTGGGFVTPETNLTQVPEFTLYGDGRVIVTGPMIEIWPPPALPNLQTTTISEEATEQILSAAQKAGLFANDVDYGQPGITDMPTTTITLNTGGQTYISSIYALAMEQGAGGLTLEQQQARAAINELAGKLVDLTAFETSAVTWEPYVYTALAVISVPVEPSSSPANTDVQPNSLDWPLGDLGTLGQAVTPAGYRNVVVSGKHLSTLQPLLSEATQITLWKSGDTEYHLFFRPLLPNET